MALIDEGVCYMEIEDHGYDGESDQYVVKTISRCVGMRKSLIYCSRFWDTEEL